MGDWSAALIGKRERATGTKTFTIERPSDLEYRAGQFFFVSIPAPEAPGGWLLHHFSFSSSPTEPNVEFTTRLTGHEFKDRLDALEPGTRLRIAGPDGDFVLRPEWRRAAYLAGGVGITPVRSTVRWALDTRASTDIVVLYANRDLASAAFREEFAGLDSPPVRVVDILSHPDADWRGPTGHIDADFVREQVPDWRERHFFVSGPPGMARSLAAMVADELRVGAENLTAELFPGYE